MIYAFLAIEMQTSPSTLSCCTLLELIEFTDYGTIHFFSRALFSFLGFANSSALAQKVELSSKATGIPPIWLTISVAKVKEVFLH